MQELIPSFSLTQEWLQALTERDSQQRVNRPLRRCSTLLKRDPIEAEQSNHAPQFAGENPGGTDGEQPDILFV